MLMDVVRVLCVLREESATSRAATCHERRLCGNPVSLWCREGGSACVAFFLCAHRAARLSDCTSQGYGQYRSDVSVGMFVCGGGSLSPVLMQAHQCQGCSSSLLR